MKALPWVIGAFAAFVACTNESEPRAPQDPVQTLRIGSEEVQLLRSDAPFNQVEAQFKLPTPRRMSNGIIQLTTMRGRPEVAALLEAAWRHDTTRHPDFNWKSIETPTVKLTIAAVLGQWATDKTEYRVFVERYLDSTDTMTRMDAVIALGTIGDTSDIEKLAEYAVGEDELLAMSALGTLRSLATRDAYEVVRSVAENPSLTAARRAEAAKMLGEQE